jgi:hypothetical protein
MSLLQAKSTKMKNKFKKEPSLLHHLIAEEEIKRKLSLLPRTARKKKETRQKNSQTNKRTSSINRLNQ